MSDKELKIDLKGLTAWETEEWVKVLGLERFRATQLRQWLFKKSAGSFEEMTNISRSLRELFNRKANIRHLKKVKTQVSQDSTEKHLFRLSDGHLIESVLIPERSHYTLCISSQAGCAMGCRFCLTAKQGLKRDLTSAEIIEQVIQIKGSMKEPERLTNIVFMGMGEPLANYSAVIRAASNMIAEDGLNFSHRKVTLSTCGLVPQLRKLAQEITVNLAVSLNASDDKTRDLLMPVNRSYPLKRLISACKDFPLPSRRMITFEYILIHGMNDRKEDALRLVKLLSSLRAKINLIPLNPFPGLAMSPPPLKRIHRFQDILIRNHFTAIIRKSKGRDISAACGQLIGEEN